ncbi:MAG: phytanoyl-CoA dioxygenase family protein [Planctomycetes bacterium]|nr:phytanoyl-CoA dioxygenase family protein [Planctomycetota bacterium]
MLTSSLIADYQRDGYIIRRGLFSPEEAEDLRRHFMNFHDAGNYPGAKDIDPASPDPLRRYPRIMMPHRWDAKSLKWLTDPRIAACLTELLGLDPFGVQTMFYFKPPGARGQAYHQDQFYLRTQPGTCVAAWMAVDVCDSDNGCLYVIPGTQNVPVLCTIKADTIESWTDVTVPLPKGVTPVPVIQQPGDVLFFNGSVIHGSMPNRSQRFRCSMIGHYVLGNAQRVAKWYHPVLRMDGSEVPIGISEGGGPCGVWSEKDGQRVVELVNP